MTGGLRGLLDLPPHSIHDMSREAKDSLAPFLRQYSQTYQINVLFTDFYQEAATPQLAYLINQGKLSDLAGPPALDIKANLNADWWIAVSTPMGWYSYVDSEGWQSGLHPYIQTSLTEIDLPLELPGISVGTGLYTYYFAVDDNADGVPDADWVDKVEVNTTSWR